MATYKIISRNPINVSGYLPKYNIEYPEPETPVKVQSPIIEEIQIKETDDNESEQTNNEEIPSYTGSKYNAFKTAYTNSGADQSRFNFFAKLASKESGFDPYIQNKLGAPAYGYFQFMQGTSDGRSWDNITRFANTDVETFRKSPELQIKAAQKLADSFLKGFSKEDYKKARELGYSDSALLAGAWLGGVGGVRKFLHNGISVNDKSWSKGKNIGTDMQTRMREFNNLFKKGGILKFQAGGTGEIKSDDRSWLRKQWDKIATKYNSSQWAESAPAAVLAGFTPFGLWHYTTAGDKDSARLAILPGAAIASKVAKAEKAAEAAKEGMELVYKHYGDDITKYFSGSLENLRNPDVTISIAERFKVPKKLEKIEIADDLRHDYSFFTNSTGVPTLKVSATATDPKYIGEKAAAKQFLQELVGTTSNNGIKGMTIPEKELFARQYWSNTTSTLSEKDIYSRLMAYKAESGITSSFEKLTEKEAKELFSKAYDSNLFHSKGEKELFWEKNKDKILSIFRRVPTLLSAGIVGDKVIKSKAGTKLKDPKAVGEVPSQETIKWMQDKNGEVSYAKRYKHNYPEFWGRLTQLNKESIPDWEDPRKHATHKLSWGTNEDKVIVYPEVQKIKGKLVDFSRPPYHQFAGMDNALETGNYVEAPSENIANNFTKTYKQNYKGFPDHDIFSNEIDRKTFHLRSDKANYLYKKLLDAGYNSIQASAIIGSAYVEGQLLENAREKGNSEQGYGIMQWTNPTRLQNLKNFKSKTASNEFERQVDFLIHELKDNSVWNSKEATLQQFLNAKDIDTATILFTKGYLNPKTGLEHFNRRKEVARYYSNNQPDYNFNIF